jgi:small subunit ribosomal protein S8
MDVIADLLSQIKNAYMAHKDQVVTDWSKNRQSVAEVLSNEGYIGEVKVKKLKNNKKNMVINLKYDDQGRPVVTQIKRISKPGCRIYTSANKIPRSLGGVGITILSTSEGVMTGYQARKNNLGGEVICQVY